MPSDILERIEERRTKLYAVGEDLKKHFVGIDEPIDRLLFNIEAWWCMPELMTRPTITCLWGLTGVGKTDLIRKLMQGLEMVDSFVEIQMTNKGSANHYESSLQSLLSGSNISEEQPGVLLLDEMQRFRSIDNSGKEIDDYRFQDLWMLLSDGSFSNSYDNKDSLMQMLFEDAYWDDYNKAKETVSKDSEDEEEIRNEKEIERRRHFKRTYWSARQMKREFRLSEPIEEIMQWDGKKKLEVLNKKLEDKSIYDAVSYPRLLVLIAGNLDEAYQMAHETNETDVDADLFHKHSQRINLLRIKGALRDRFKPEQIARFGNAHIIYPALSRSSYETIIQRKVDSIVENCKEHSGVSFEVDKSFLDAIYRNGVFPAQGTRPVFSTISCFFECTLPQFVYQCVKADVKEAKLYYKDKHLCCDLPDGTFSIKNEGEIDQIKAKKRNEDKVLKVAVHEAGHALVYAKLFGVMPTQIAVNLASDDTNGFIGLHEVEFTKQMSLNKIAVMMAGRTAEEFVFGSDNIGAGACGDIGQATATAANYIRRWGMGEHISRLQLPSNGADDAGHCNNDIDSSNEIIEQLLKEQKTRAKTIVEAHRSLLVAISEHLVEWEKIEQDDFIALCKDHGVECEYLDAKETVLPQFRKAYKEFLDRENMGKVADKHIQ